MGAQWAHGLGLGDWAQLDQDLGGKKGKEFWKLYKLPVKSCLCVKMPPPSLQDPSPSHMATCLVLASFLLGVTWAELGWVCVGGTGSSHGSSADGCVEVFRSGPQTLWVTLSPGAPGHGESHLVGLGRVPGDSEGSVHGCAGLRKCTCWYGDSSTPVDAVWVPASQAPPSELVTLVTVTGEDVTLPPRPLHHLVLCESAFTQGGGSPAILGFKPQAGLVL